MAFARANFCSTISEDHIDNAMEIVSLSLKHLNCVLERDNLQLSRELLPVIHIIEELILKKYDRVGFKVRYLKVCD